MKPRTVNTFIDCLDQERAWRVKEISYSATNVKKSSGSISERALIRASIPLIYAHWEGFIKCSARTYLEFIEFQRHKYSDLLPCFAVLGFKSKLNTLSESKKSKLNIESFEYLINNLDDIAKLQIETAINTESNLKSHVFENIAISIGIETSKYEPSYNFIDESLLKRRNTIAHGDYLDVDSTSFEEIKSRVVMLMDWFKTDLENAAVRRSYMRSTLPISTPVTE
ncbi:MAE_28990/MAE_18760 family HEPN-like nuclease [Pseudomonas zeae]|jgi:hypothetical protein|uniref:MAE_28990/MAE_18760 family HEPN-like nuclease n=1 Tax=Pseudomonas zeae TaxID=2745510 RepID=UPI00214900A0|nr:MAE_28990/MAE_18760 family HEPN-like nuclease [Pseudomonas zeae]UUT14536.1 MAE_28990/MAE_18760 family HEPN-like nuclease [Pseudomonas zeae]